MSKHTKCSFEGCTETVPSGNAERTSMWHKMRATDAGWFFQVNGDAWCPKHTPDWVEGWRAKKNNQKDDG